MLDSEEIIRPDPIPKIDSVFFWQALEDEVLMAQQCGDCSIFLHPPRPMCPNCNSLNQQKVPLSGRGRLYSWCMPQHPKIPMFHYPLITALIDLEEGIRILSNLIECDTNQITTGMALEVCFAPTKGGKKVHQFRPLCADVG
ncbi:MAG: OB-fold domain-containing protein [Gammaproteobacteria bacterium]|nr:OB-fold domain-containing protein [Gammaproteobacteria bacterium]